MKIGAYEIKKRRFRRVLFESMETNDVPSRGVWKGGGDDGFE